MKYNFGKLQMYFLETADIMYINVLFKTCFDHLYKKKDKEQNTKTDGVSVVVNIRDINIIMHIYANRCVQHLLSERLLSA